jgi:hypothetical protein
MSIIRINDGKSRILIVEPDCSNIAPALTRWYAYDDNYDGAEDSRTRCQIGYGTTALDAVTDYLENYGDE